MRMEGNRKNRRGAAAENAAAGALLGGIAGTIFGGLVGYFLLTQLYGEPADVDFAITLRWLFQAIATITGAVIGGVSGMTVGSTAAVYWWSEDRDAVSTLPIDNSLPPETPPKNPVT
jgi:hypothetical protein